MNTQCKIVEDLLPLYHDGICSEETRQMVAEHLTHCEHCRKLLTQIDGELVSPRAEDADIRPLKKITRTVNKGKRKALFAGISIAISAALILFAGLSFWWYTQEYAYYTPFAEGQSPHSIHWYDDDGNIGKSIVTDSGKYTWYDDIYRYDVDVPVFLSGTGRVEMTRLDNTENMQVSLSVSRWKGTKYVFQVSFFGTEHNWYDEDGNIHWPHFMVDSELNLYYPDHWTTEIIEENSIKFTEYKEDVQVLVNDALAMWSFIE